MKYLALFLLPFSLSLFGKTDVALVKMFRGDVQVKSQDGTTQKASKGMWLDQGQTIVTGKKSFARLVFKDKTSSNVGANSELEIKSFVKGKPGLLNLIKGQIRTKVVKDTLNQGKSKLFIKTKTAAMGVRGTDFHVSVGQDDKTTVLTYSGAVSMVQFNDRIKNMNSGNFDRILNRAQSVIVTAGRFSSTSEVKRTVNLPVKIAPTQLAKLQDNLGLKESGKSYSRSTASESTKSITPPGISSQIAFKNDETKSADAYFAPAGDVQTEPDPKQEPSQMADLQPPPQGMDIGDRHAPAAGGFIDLASGNYVEPPKGAQFDPNTETFIVPKNFGDIDVRTGDFLPPPPEDFNMDPERAPSSDDGAAFIGEHKFVPRMPNGELKIGDIGTHNPEQFDPNQPPPLGADGQPITEDFFDENIGDLDPCLVDINTCQDFNAPPPGDAGGPAFLNFTTNFPEG